MDMLHGSMWDKIIRYALPVAAVGANSPIVGLLLNLFIGIALGANVVIANAIGRKDEGTIHRAVHTSVIAAVIGGLLVTVLGELLIGNLLAMLNVPSRRCLF